MDKISALMDGELDEHQAGGQLLRLKQNDELASGWHTFHLIGDAMRGERPLSPDFNRQLAARMAAEPTVLAPHRSVRRRAATYALSAAASVSAVAFVGWMAFVNYSLAPQSEIAQAPVLPAAAVSAPQIASVPSDGKMNDYLIAHREFSPSTAIQGLAPLYIRNVSSTQQLQGR